MLVENLFIIVGLLPILYYKNQGFHKQIFINLKMFLLLGLLNAIATIVVFSAVGEGNVGIISTILNSQILLILFFSALLFKDKLKAQTLIGSIIMILGVVLIKIGS